MQLALSKQEAANEAGDVATKEGRKDRYSWRYSQPQRKDEARSHANEAGAVAAMEGRKDRYSWRYCQARSCEGRMEQEADKEGCSKNAAGAIAKQSQARSCKGRMKQNAAKEGKKNEGS